MNRTLILIILSMTFLFPVTALSQPLAPTLTVTTNGLDVTMSWSSVVGADGYRLLYAPLPYTGTSTIGQANAGNITSAILTLWDGASFAIAIQAYNDLGDSPFSNIRQFNLVAQEELESFTNSFDMTFKLLPAGTFMMGSPEDEPGRVGNETQYQVTISESYYIQTTEVTQAQWGAVMGENPSFNSGCPECPVEQVSWDDVQDFIQEMNKRRRREGTYFLPTEAQWEYAARAGRTTAFANGGITETGNGYDPNLDAMGWYSYNSDGVTHPVAQKDPNAWGLYDMHGNVWEWVQDRYGAYPTGPAIDPTGSVQGLYPVVRGGYWEFSASHCRSAYRHAFVRSDRLTSLGFRLALSPGQ